MLKKSIFIFVVLFVALAVPVSFALVEFSDKGGWPYTWPEELEKFREQSYSFSHVMGIEESWHEITFRNREEFEQAWPYILQLKTEGSPLTLASTQNPKSYLISSTSFIQPGIPFVRIYCTANNSPTQRKITSELQLPFTWPIKWPDYLRLPSGGLPEYVAYRDGKLVPVEKESYSIELGLEEAYVRARVDIVLVTDGEIVDLNRIAFPQNTPIIDKRFEDVNSLK